MSLIRSTSTCISICSEIIPAKPTSNKVTQASLTKLGERIVKKFNLNPGTALMTVSDVYKVWVTIVF